jgi:hypothetical protein
LDLAQIAGLAEAEIATAEDARRQALSLVNDLRRDKEELKATQNVLNAESRTGGDDDIQLCTLKSTRRRRH